MDSCWQYRVSNPDDIATTTVLKDAAAASIYGARAANGLLFTQLNPVQEVNVKQK
ncbi:hypothetical protein Q2T40_04025 [Winogradskyella maritima]|nr:hypothetical protein [Winogradskyella maritima]